jgi:actinorhodin biosynthesis protein ActVIA
MTRVWSQSEPAEDTLITDTPTATDLYVQIQRFYAAQIHLLDDVRADDFAATFTEDGEFSHDGSRTTARGRTAIAQAVISYNERFRDDPVQRRHWINMLDVRPQEDGTIHNTFYALVLTTRKGKTPLVGPSCVTRDVLIFDQDGCLYTRSRIVEHDQD